MIANHPCINSHGDKRLNARIKSESNIRLFINCVFIERNGCIDMREPSLCLQYKSITLPLGGSCSSVRCIKCMSMRMQTVGNPPHDKDYAFAST